MKRIDIDFAPPSPMRTLLRTGWPTWIAVVIGLAFATTAAVAVADMMAQRNAHDAALSLIQAQRAKRDARRPAVVKFSVPDAQVLAVNTAVAQLNLPWRDVLDAVEAATPATIALLSLEPDAKKKLVRGVAEAKTSDTMIAYIEDLKKQAYFRNVVLSKHETNEQDPNKPLRFHFDAQWVEAAP